MNSTGTEREILTYDLFGHAIKDLAQTIVDDYKPDLILSIARGGLLIGGALGYAMGVKNVSVINVEFYTGIGETLEAPVMLLTEAVDLSAGSSSPMTSPTRQDPGLVQNIVPRPWRAPHRDLPQPPITLTTEEDRPVDRLPGQTR